MARFSLGLSLLLTMFFLGTSSAWTPANTTLAADLSPLVSFPADQAAHSQSHNEWWYVVGHVRTPSRTFGYEVTVFKFNKIKPPGLNSEISLYRTDVAITDEGKNHFFQHVTYYFPGSATTSTRALRVKVGNASLVAGSSGTMHLHATLPSGQINVQLRSLRKPMYVGGRGYLRFGNGYTYYYSLTDLATEGTLTIGRHRFMVRGTSWMDHQWGNWDWQSIRGWTWMALQLNNGTQLSVFDFRGTTTRIKAASVLLTNGTLRTERTTTTTATGHWISPHTGGHYPSGWIVRIPSLKATLVVSPTVRDQELAVKGQSFGSYWEGSGRVRGTFGGKSVTGLAYTELTGYAAGFGPAAYP
ncbi:MAG: lipocalin-like domain-containing protein [Chloroflexota bacterium]